MTVTRRLAWVWLAGLLVGCGGKSVDASDSGTTSASETTDTTGSTTPTSTATGASTSTDTGTSGSTGTPTGTGESWGIEDLGGVCPPDGSTRVGGFQISHTPDFPTLAGNVTNGVVPSDVRTLSTTEGDCTLFQKEPLLCSPSCGAGETCDFDGTCIPYPTNQGLGTVTIVGTTEPVTMEPTGLDTYWDALAYPLFAPDAAMVLSASGDEVEAFTLRGLGVSEMVQGEPEWRVVEGEPLTITWEPGTGEHEVFASMNIDQHGISPAVLECVFADTGSGTVPAELLASFVRYGVSGFATGLLRRRTADSVTTSMGCVDLVVSSDVVPEVTVDGHWPCFVDRDCPDGYTCDEPLNTCIPE